MHVSAKADYAIRALVEIANQGGGGRLVAADAVATAQDIPRAFLLGLLADLRRGGVVASQRGASGGWVLARPASEITLAQVVRTIEGPLASVHGKRPEALRYGSELDALQQVWIAVRASLRDVLETVTLADLLDNRLPDAVARRALPTDAWQPH